MSSWSICYLNCIVRNKKTNEIFKSHVTAGYRGNSEMYKIEFIRDSYVELSYFDSFEFGDFEISSSVGK
jgi:hypothetical protein